MFIFLWLAGLFVIYSTHLDGKFRRERVKADKNRWFYGFISHILPHQGVHRIMITTIIIHTCWFVYAEVIPSQLWISLFGTHYCFIFQCPPSKSIQTFSVDLKWHECLNIQNVCETLHVSLETLTHSSFEFYSPLTIG